MENEDDSEYSSAFEFEKNQQMLSILHFARDFMNPILNLNF